MDNIINHKTFKTLRVVISATLLILSSHLELQAQQRIISGRIVDGQKRPITNAYLKSESAAATTDNNGYFTIMIAQPESEKSSHKTGISTPKDRAYSAIVSKDGFFRKRVLLTDKMEITLEATKADEIVQEIYGSRSEKLITSSISTLDGKSIAGNSVQTFADALSGRLPGLYIKQGSGSPGNKTVKSIYIRGKHSYTGSNAPLVLIDGFERSLDNLNVDQVESVSVLKDAASTALYGMDGANGVILVTTRRGKEGAVSVDFKAEYGSESPIKLPRFYNSYEFASAYNQAQLNDGVAENLLMYRPEQLAGYKNHTDDKLYPDVNWIEQTTRKYSPLSQKYVVNVTGGNKSAKFFINLGYANNQGIYKELGNKPYDANNSLERINFRSNLDLSIGKYLSVKLDLSGYMDNMNSPTMSDKEIWSNFYTFNPNTTAIYARDGVWGGKNNALTNPAAYINDQGYTRTHRRLFQTNITADYDFSKYVKGLHIGGKAAFDSFYAVENGYTKSFAVQQVTGLSPEYDPETGLGDYYAYSDIYGNNSILSPFGPRNETQNNYDSFEGYINYDRIFGCHNISVKAIYHQDNWQDGQASFSPSRRINVSTGLYYSFKQRYMLDLVAQYGGSEKFIKGSRFGIFPAISAGWIISNESFMQNQTVIDFLKIRGSFGIVGNQNIGGTRFGYRQLYTSYGSWNTGPDNSATGSGYIESDLGNRFLTWEKGEKMDVGLDIGLLKNLKLSLTYFRESRSDILNSATSITPNYLGASFSYINWGRVRNTGAEAAISYDKQYRNWGYDLSFNVAYQQNMVLSSAEATQDEFTLSTIWTSGMPIGQYIGATFEGFYTREDITSGNYKKTYGTVIPGSIKANGYGPIGSDTDVPSWDMGLNLSVNYKGVYVSANFQGCVGMTVNLRQSAPLASSPLYANGNNIYNVHKWVSNPWTEDKASNKHTAKDIDAPSFTLDNSRINRVTSSFWMKNGDFLRMRNLEIGYNIPPFRLNKSRVCGINVYLRGTNLFTLSHLDFFDPEVQEGYPIMKSYNIGVSLKF